MATPSQGPKFGKVPATNLVRCESADDVVDRLIELYDGAIADIEKSFEAFSKGKQKSARDPVYPYLTLARSEAKPWGGTEGEGVEHVPLVGSHTPASWHWSAATQVTGLIPAQTPATQVSVIVHSELSSLAAPSGLEGFEHVPVVVSQTPTTWHWSIAVHTTPTQWFGIGQPPAAQGIDLAGRNPMK